MTIKPIPDILLGDSVTLLIPASGKWNEKKINNIRVERTGAVNDYSSQRAREQTTITVWFDFAKSSPKTDISAGMGVRYHGEVYEVTESKIYSADAPHHLKFTARKTGGVYTEANL